MYERERAVAEDAVIAAGRIVTQYYGTPLGSREKENWRELVTKADIEANTAIISVIRAQFPDHAIFSEESGHAGVSPFVWYIDPLDGTTNFLCQIPFFCTAIGLWHEGEPTVSAIYNPLSDELFSASKGHGAQLNGTTIHASANSDITKTLIMFCAKNTRSDAERLVSVFPELKTMGRDARQPGAGDLEIAYIAAGRTDAYFSSSKIFDIAPALCLAIEAGCRITDWKGDAWSPASKGIVITNGTTIHENLVRVLARV